MCCTHSLSHCNTLTLGPAKMRCNTPQHNPTLLNKPAIHLQYTCNGFAETCAVVCERVCCSVLLTISHTLQHTYIRPCQNALQHTATHSNTPEQPSQRTLPKQMLQCVRECVAVCCTHSFTHYNTLTSDLAEIHCNTLHHTPTHCNTPATGLAETLPSAPTLLFIQEVTPPPQPSLHTPPFVSLLQHSLFALSRTK